MQSTSFCHNGATCVNNNGSYQCTCSAGYTGINCQTNINECHSNLCLHNSTCIDGINTYKCNCANGYTGHNCETDFNECQSSPCQHNGHCRNTVGSFYCNCTATGYSGPLCDTGMAVLAAMSMSIFSILLQRTCILNSSSAITFLSELCLQIFLTRKWPSYYLALKMTLSWKFAYKTRKMCLP